MAGWQPVGAHHVVALYAVPPAFARLVAAPAPAHADAAIACIQHRVVGDVGAHHVAAQDWRAVVELRGHALEQVALHRDEEDIHGARGVDVTYPITTPEYQDTALLTLAWMEMDGWIAR